MSLSCPATGGRKGHGSPCVMFLYRDEYYNPETTEKPNVCDVIIAKQRSGPTGTVELAWLGKYTRFVDKSPIRD